MDEAVRIYQPSFHLNAGDYVGRHARYEESVEPEEPEAHEEPVKPVTVVEELKMNYEPEPEPERKDPWKKLSYLETLMSVFKDREKKERRMMLKFPWFNLVYNWLITIGVIALFASFWWWGVQIRNNHKEQAIRESVYAEVQAQEQAKETARLEALALEQSSEDYIVGQMADAMAKLFYGIRNFEEKYHYNETDFETYARCWFNRAENKAYSGDLIEVMTQKDQALGYYDSNPVLNNYRKMAEKFIRAWRSESIKPVSNDYVYAELTPNGIYLKNEFNADGYARRWRAS